MRSALAVLAVALLGLFGATSIGYAAYLVSRDSVGLPVTKLKLSPDQLAPTPTTRKAVKPKPRTTGTATTSTTTTQTPTRTSTSADDHGGRSRGSGDSGHGGGSDD